MPVQNTFTLVPESCAANFGAAPTRIMTSRQIKKAHREANRKPRLSRAERRKQELAEQERIRKELEQERVAARARVARERKKAKEEAQREARRRSGKPLVDVRPSQDTIAKFLVRGNGTSKKRDSRGIEVHTMEHIKEEESTGSRDVTPEGPMPAGEHVDEDAVPGGEEASVCPAESPHEVDGGTPPQIQPDPVDTGREPELEQADTEPDYDTLPLSQRKQCMQDKCISSSAPVQSTAAHGRVSSDDRFDEFDDDDFLGLQTQPDPPRGDILHDPQGEEQQHSHSHEISGHSRPEQISMPTDAGIDFDISDDGLEDDELEALDTILVQPSSQRNTTDIPAEDDGWETSEPPGNAQDVLSNEFSSFAADDLDEEILAQLEAPADDNPPSPSHGPSAASEVSSVSKSAEHTRKETPQASLEADADLGTELFTPQPPPLSTQHVLLNHDDFFPSPSQQERELSLDVSLPTTPLRPHLPTSNGGDMANTSPSDDAAGPPRKRFFSASGSNQLLSLAVHRSRRSAALHDIQTQERHRLNAGLAQAARHIMPESSRQSSRPSPPPQVQPPRFSAQQQQSMAPPPPKFIKNASKQLQSALSGSTPPKVKASASSGKENDPQIDGAPSASQESEYGGHWLEEIELDLSTDGCGLFTLLAGGGGEGKLR